MDSFVSAFQEEYGDFKQVSSRELQKLVMRMHGVTDKRSIQNRVDYFVASGYIRPFAPNVYDILGQGTIVDHVNQPRIDQLQRKDELEKYNEFRIMNAGFYGVYSEKPPTI